MIRFASLRSVPPAALGLAAVAILVALLPGELTAQLQADQLGRQGLGRAYWHVFASYAVAWLLIFGWVIAMFRRLKRVEERLGSDE